MNLKDIRAARSACDRLRLEIGDDLKQTHLFGVRGGEQDRYLSRAAEALLEAATLLKQAAAIAGDI